MARQSVKIKRVYEPADKADGKRILIDRLWPRGLTKEKAKVDLWLKDIAPTSELRSWFKHDPEKWSEFQLKYRAEIESNTEVLKRLKTELEAGQTTLVYSARDEHHNDAVVLKTYLEEHN